MRRYHLQLDDGEVGGYALLPGDPGRCELIARFLDGARHVRSNREFTTYAGGVDGAPVCAGRAFPSTAQSRKPGGRARAIRSHCWRPAPARR